MTLPHLVTSLELSKRLKELGVKQESIFAWYFANDRDDEPALNRHPDKGCVSCSHPLPPYFEWVSAFTAGELGEMLKDSGWALPTYSKTYGGEEWGAGIHRAHTEADARAVLLIHLVEIKHITIENVLINVKE